MNPDNQATEARWRPLYRAGATAPLIALAFYLFEFSILIVGEPYPTTVESWYALAQRSKLLTLWYLNALDIISFALLGIMFLALQVALHRSEPSRTLVATYFALLGAAVFIVPRALHLSLLPLSDLHAAATSETWRTVYLAAGEGLAHVSSATPQTLGFLFMAVAGFLHALTMLQRRSFSRATAWVGIAGFIAALANYVSRLLAPDIAAILMPINGLLWFTWWVMISAGLFKLARATTDG